MDVINDPNLQNRITKSKSKQVLREKVVNYMLNRKATIIFFNNCIDKRI